MTKEEREKAAQELIDIRLQIDLLYQQAFTAFVEAVHNLSLMVQPLTKQAMALAYKLEKVEAKLDASFNKQDSLE